MQTCTWYMLTGRRVVVEYLWLWLYWRTDPDLHDLYVPILITLASPSRTPDSCLVSSWWCSVALIHNSCNLYHCLLTKVIPSFFKGIYFHCFCLFLWSAHPQTPVFHKISFQIIAVQYVFFTFFLVSLISRKKWVSILPVRWFFVTVDCVKRKSGFLNR